LTNRFAWYGTRRRFDTLTHTFKRTGAGHFNAHHYRYSPEMSTFIVEVDAATYDAAGFDRMGEEETRGCLEAVFGEELGGHKLVSNKSAWRQFPKLWNARWWVGNRVLVGDALHTAHFSIGSGTRLAMEDVVALVRALEAYRGDLPAALAAYEAARRPVVEKLVEAANASAAWYEEFPRHMALEPWAFAESYLMRSGRVSPARLAQLAPRFARGLARRASPQ
jgi:2-polyprenyl-6-methoxyphenol hydroxylase-like FAD-dependent oxidoreductase